MTISLSAYVTLICLYSPKLYIIILHPEKNVRSDHNDVDDFDDGDCGDGNNNVALITDDVDDDDEVTRPISTSLSFIQKRTSGHMMMMMMTMILMMVMVVMVMIMLL